MLTNARYQKGSSMKAFHVVFLNCNGFLCKRAQLGRPAGNGGAPVSLLALLCAAAPHRPGLFSQLHTQAGSRGGEEGRKTAVDRNKEGAKRAGFGDLARV